MTKLTLADPFCQSGWEEGVGGGWGGDAQKSQDSEKRWVFNRPRALDFADAICGRWFQRFGAGILKDLYTNRFLFWPGDGWGLLVVYITCVKLT